MNTNLKHMDLYGNVSYKKQLWNHLWENKHKASVKADQHETSFVLLSRIQSVLRFASNTLVGTGAFLLGISDETAQVTVIVLNVLAITIQVIEAASNMEQNKLEHKQSCERYRDICGEIERAMAVKRSGAQFTEVLDTLSSSITTADRSSPYIMSFIERKHPLTIPDVPLIPVSPEVSININGNDTRKEYFQWSSDYPILSTDDITNKYYSDPNNIAHYVNDSNGYVINVDENCCYFTGLQRDDIISPSGFGWVSKIYREDSEFTLDQWKKSVSERILFLEKYRFVHPDNAIVYIIAEGYPRFSKNKDFLGMEGILLNVPEPVWTKFDPDQYRTLTRE